MRSGQHFSEGLSLTKPIMLDWPKTDRLFMQLCCSVLTPMVINCHGDKFSGSLERALLGYKMASRESWGLLPVEA